MLTRDLPVALLLPLRALSTAQRDPRFLPLRRLGRRDRRSVPMRELEVALAQHRIDSWSPRLQVPKFSF